MSTKNKLKQLDAKRSKLLQSLLASAPMIKGTFSKIYRRCGKDGCWCTSEEGHPLSRLTWVENGNSKTRSVDIKDIPAVKMGIHQRRHFNEIQKRIFKIDLEIKLLLKEYRDQLIEQGKRKLKINT